MHSGLHALRIALHALRIVLPSCQIFQTDASAPAMQAFRRKLRSSAVQSRSPRIDSSLSAYALVHAGPGASRSRPRAPFAPYQAPPCSNTHYLSLSCRLLGWLALQPGLLVNLVFSGAHQSSLHARLFFGGAPNISI